MIKKIFSIAIVAFSLIAIPATAQDNSSVPSATANTGISKECVKKNDKRDKKAERKADRQAMELQGMKLNDTQKKQLADLREKTRAEKKQRSEASKTERRQKSEEAKAERKQRKEQKMQARRNYLNEVKKIVGEDNYVVFLENQFVMSSDRHGDKAKMHGAKKGKNSKGGKDRMHAGKNRKSEKRSA